MKLIILLAAALLPVFGRGQTFPEKVDSYIRPFVETQNFNGVVLVAQKGTIVYLKAFGEADAAHRVPNTLNTKFHIASLSKSFTAAAILLLQERGVLHVTDPVSTFIPDYPGGSKITIHHLLTHTSGIPNINNMPEYATISRFPQTPATLIAAFMHKPPDFEPGAREEPRVHLLYGPISG
jgi:CubicO group peptidase (beta-lactamase class C family)